MTYPVHWPSVTEMGRTESWEMNVARGLVKNHTSLNISGYQGDIGTTFIPVWENNTPYVYPSNGTMLLWSSSALDVNVLIQIIGLDSDYNLITEELLLTNGATGITTVNAYKRIQSISVIDGVNPVGIIRLGNAAKNQIYAQINAGCGTSAMTIYTVPAGHTFYLEKVNAYSNQGNNQLTNFRSYTVNSSGIIRAILQVPFINSYISEKSIPRGYAEKTDCQWQCNSSNSSQVGIQIEGILVKNDTP